MGKKINPKILRINTTASHSSKWFAHKQQFPDYLEQDVKLRKLLKAELTSKGLSRIEIKRSSESITIVVYTSKPGMVIGRSGVGIDELKKKIKKELFGSEKINISIEIEEVRKPELDSALVAQNIIYQLEKRVPFRRAMKRGVESVMEAGAKGVKIMCAGRLNGVEIARTETLTEGSIPTHTLRADLDYYRDSAQTIYGKIGIKVWIYRGLVFADEQEERRERENKPTQRKRRSNKKPNGEQSKQSRHNKKRTIVKNKKAKEVATPQADAAIKSEDTNKNNE